MYNDELNKEGVIEVFRQNFNYPIVKTPLGAAIQMPARDAFIFCNVTGSGYLDSYNYQFTPKGLMKLFYNAFDFKFVTGVFDNTSLLHTPYILSKKYSWLFDSETKYVVPIEFESEISLQDFLESLYESLPNPTDYVVMRIEKSKKGNGMESFMEFLTAEYFKKMGFIVENQIPLAHSIGSPDFGGYDLTEIQSITKDYLPYGFHIIELSMLRLQFNTLAKYHSEQMYPSNLIVGEAKTSTKNMNKQLKKYLNTGLFDFGLEIHPNKTSPTKMDRGLITLDKDYKIKYTHPQCPYKLDDSRLIQPKEDYIKWLNMYMKFYLLANFTNDELMDYYTTKTNEPISSQESIVEFVKSLNPNDIISQIKLLIKT